MLTRVRVKFGVEIKNELKKVNRLSIPERSSSNSGAVSGQRHRGIPALQRLGAARHLFHDHSLHDARKRRFVFCDLVSRFRISDGFYSRNFRHRARCQKILQKAKFAEIVGNIEFEKNEQI